MKLSEQWQAREHQIAPEKRFLQMPAQITVRQPPKGYVPEQAMLSDSWPNVSLLTSLIITKELEDTYRSKEYSFCGAQ